MESTKMLRMVADVKSLEHVNIKHLKTLVSLQLVFFYVTGIINIATNTK